jgi:hypothetical protein
MVLRKFYLELPKKCFRSNVIRAIVVAAPVHGKAHLWIKKYVVKLNVFDEVISLSSATLIRMTFTPNNNFQNVRVGLNL